jgi:hypothetical protein
MRKFSVIFVFVLVFGAFASAQLEPKPIEVPNTELFIGYAYQHANTSGSNIADSANLNGFDFSLSHYFHGNKLGNLGYMIDVARGSNHAVDSTGIKYTRVSYMGGPTYRVHNFGFVSASVHALAGVDHDDFTVPYANTSTVIDYTDTALAIAGGVTVDGNLSRHIAIRLAQVDYLFTNHDSTNQSSFRYAGGVVVRF